MIILYKVVPSNLSKLTYNLVNHGFMVGISVVINQVITGRHHLVAQKLETWHLFGGYQTKTRATTMLLIIQLCMG